VDCCTDIHGQTDCHLTTLGRYTPGAGLILAQSIPDDDTERGSYERLLEAARSLDSRLWPDLRIPTPAELLEALGNLPAALLGELPDVKLPDVNINVPVPEGFGLTALLPAALLGLVIGGGLALVVKKK
jgi:hypothetical protein